MKKYQVTAIFTCFNRKEKTLECIRSLVEGNPTVEFHFIVVDDASTDGTGEALKEIKYVDITVVSGTGSLFWCGGMRKGIEFFLQKEPVDDAFCLLVNDDVQFYPNSIENMFNRLKERNDYVIVGATCDTQGNFTYGLKCKEAWYKKNITKRIYPSEEEVIGETFNANCVLIPNSIVKKMGNLDPLYQHSLGDYDYGFRMARNGIKLISTEGYVGVCNSNSSKGTWNDRSLSRKERLKKKESPKGSPAKEWWHFLRVNFGICSAIKYSIIPYVKIMLGK